MTRHVPWIIGIGDKYLAHPRGGLTDSAVKAYKYYYKKDAEKRLETWCHQMGFTMHQTAGVLYATPTEGPDLLLRVMQPSWLLYKN